MIIENYEISSRNVLLRALGGALRVRFLISGGGTLYLGEDGNVASFLLGIVAVAMIGQHPPYFNLLGWDDKFITHRSDV